MAGDAPAFSAETREALERAAEICDLRQKQHRLAIRESKTPTVEKLLAEQAHSIAASIRAIKPLPKTRTQP